MSGWQNLFYAWGVAYAYIYVAFSSYNINTAVAIDFAGLCGVGRC